jgi:hypothetical protein
MSDVIKMNNLIKHDKKPPLGVYFWAQFYDNPQIRPRFEVFRYIGRQHGTGYYWFEAVKGKAIPTGFARSSLSQRRCGMP